MGEERGRGAVKEEGRRQEDRRRRHGQRAGCAQGDDKDKGAAGGGEKDLAQHQDQAPRAGRDGRGRPEGELPNHLKNCSLHSRLSPVDCALENKYFVFILSLKFVLKLKQISIAYIRDDCHHINCCEFYKFDASANWNQTQASIRSEPNKR